MNTELKIEALKDKVGSLPHNVQSAFVNVESLRAVLAERKASLLACLPEHPGPTPLVIGNSVSHPFNLVRTEQFQEFATISTTLALYEASTAYQDAAETIEPMLAEMATLEAQLAAEVAEKGQKQNALNAAVETALEAARLAALESPAVVKARRDLEALDQPAKPKRQPADSIGEVS